MPKGHNKGSATPTARRALRSARPAPPLPDVSLDLEELTAELARRAARAMRDMHLHERDPNRLQFFRGRYVTLSDLATEILQIRAAEWRGMVEREIEQLHD